MTLSRSCGIATLLGVIFIGLLTSCHDDADASKGRKLARAYDAFLYESDLQGIYSAEMSARDSAIVRKQFIDQWVREQISMSNALRNVGPYMDVIDAKVDEYRRSMLTYYYEKEYVRQHLDTNVSDREIESYYEANKATFTLRDNIVKVAFIKVGLDAPNIRQVKEFLQSDDPPDAVRLRDYCERHAENYYLQDNVWLLFNDLLREIPIKTYNQEAFLQNNRFVEMKDSLYQYMVSIKGFRIKESVSPLSFERSNIRDIILNKRKLKIVDELRKNIMTRAVADDSFEIYEEEERQ